jgi:hypothetical protein
MLLHILRFTSVMATAVAMAAGFAHLLELPAKMKLAPEEYLIVQQIYRGWALLGVVIIIALLSTLVVGVLTRDQPRVALLTLGAATCIALSLVVFFAFTFPANRATSNWTILPDEWAALRRQWEYSHAVGAALYFVALGCLTLSLLPRRT